MITGTSASASVIISFQGTSETGNIDPELSWTLDITVDNGGGGSTSDQTWTGSDVTNAILTRGPYSFTLMSETVLLNVVTGESGGLISTEFTGIIYMYDQTVQGLLAISPDLMMLDGIPDWHNSDKIDALSDNWTHDGWSVSPMSNPAVPEPTSAIVWACLLTVGCLGKRSFYSLSNRSRPKSTNV